MDIVNLILQPLELLNITLKGLNNSHAKGKDIHTLLDDERVMIRHSLKSGANSPEEAQSLKTAATQLDDAARCLDVVCNDPKGYMAGTPDLPRQEKGSRVTLGRLQGFSEKPFGQADKPLGGQRQPFRKTPAAPA